MTLWSNGLSRSSDKLKPLYHYRNDYRHQTWQDGDLLEVLLAINSHSHLGSSIKYVRSDFVISDSRSLSLYVQIHFQPTPFPPSTCVQILSFNEDMTDIFCEFLSIKEPQTTLLLQCLWPPNLVLKLDLPNLPNLVLKLDSSNLTYLVALLPKKSNGL